MGEDLHKLKYFEDLLDVGTQKMVGYLPLSTMINSGGPQSVMTTIEWAKDNHLEFQIFVEMECNISSGALFIWHPKQLQIFLYINRSILIESGIPTDHNSYITYIASKDVDVMLFPEAYVLIGKTFNDSRFR